MKKTILITAFCLGNLVLMQAQNLNKLKENNTFFILFEEGDFAKKKILDLPDKPINYTFYRIEKNSVNKVEYPFRLYYAKYFNNDDAANDINKTMTYKVHKSFLKKNKDIIITRKFMDITGVNKIVDLFYGSNNHVFIIDKSEVKDNQILIREVYFSYISPEG